MTLQYYVKISGLLLILLVATNNLSATETELVTITNDSDSDSSKIILDVDPETCEIKKIIQKNFLSTKKSSGAETKEWEVETLLDDSGLVLKEASGRDVIALKSNNISSVDGGSLTLNYLYSGLSGEEKQIDLDIEKTEEEKWTLMDTSGKEIHSMHFVVNKKRFLGAVGIKEIILK